MTERQVSTSRLLSLVGLSLAASLIFFAPRLWLMRQYVPGSFEWDRAHSYLMQCSDPFRHDVEPAMLWRVLPPLIAHVLRLPEWGALALPWLGVLAATTYVGVLFRRRCDDARFVLGGMLLFASTSAVIVATGWLGVNDAWAWLGLLVVAFSNEGKAIALACLLCPWIDERFVIGFPLAWVVRQLDAGRTWSWRESRHALWLVPYAATRLWITYRHPELGTRGSEFLSGQSAAFVTLVPLAPLGWWMGLRAGWIAAGYAVWRAPAGGRWLLPGTLVVTAVVSLLLASDMSRSIAILLPALCLGCFFAVRHEPGRAAAAVLGIGLLNLLIPAAHVVYTKINPINVLPVELFRWWRER